MRRTLITLAVTAWMLAASMSPLAASDDAAPAASDTINDEATSTPAPDWYFPVVGERGVDYDYYDTFGAPRSGGRTHDGVDIGTYGVKGVPVVAAASGWIRSVNWSHDPDDLNPERCCTIAIEHEGGWETWYIHLNNDTPGTDDGNGWGIADGIVPGVFVRAGQLIGFVGDSGNAEGTYPHLHWEVHAPGGVVVNPTPHADGATPLAAPVPDTWNGTFFDDDTSVHEANIEVIAELGVTRGCNPPVNNMYCPERRITRGEIAAFIRRLLGLPAPSTDAFSDDTDSIFHDDINAITEAGIGFGCTASSYCPDDPLRRDEMAELLVRTFDYAPATEDFFVDDGGSTFEAAINAIGAVGVTKGCNPPENDNFCPDRTLTRAEMATFFARAIQLRG